MNTFGQFYDAVLEKAKELERCEGSVEIEAWANEWEDWEEARSVELTIEVFVVFLWDVAERMYDLISGTSGPELYAKRVQHAEELAKLIGTQGEVFGLDYDEEAANPTFSVSHAIMRARG